MDKYIYICEYFKASFFNNVFQLVLVFDINAKKMKVCPQSLNVSGFVLGV